MSKPKITEVKIDQLIPDDLNANKGTEYGEYLMDKSFRQHGAGRSILLDKNNRIIAGNKSTEKCASIGIDDVIIVETDGTKLVAVKRTDIDIDTKEGRELALADNATSKANLEWDAENIKKINDEWGIDHKDWGIQDYELNSVDINPDEFQNFSNNVSTKADEFSVTFVFSKKHEKAIKKADKIELTNHIIEYCTLIS